MQKSLLPWRLKALLLFVVCTIQKFSTNAQLSFTLATSTTTTYANVSSTSGTDVFDNDEDDDISGSINIGFSFKYGCDIYSTVKVSTNGWLTLGGGSSNTLPANDLKTISNGPILAPLWDDLSLSSTGVIRYRTTGSSPSRVFTVEWREMKWSKSASGKVISFEVKLYEGSNNIDFHYKTETNNVNSGSASIGLNGGSQATDFYSIDGSGNAVYGTETNNINTKPTNNRIYRWIPQSMTYVSFINTQNNTSPISKCNNLNQEVIGIQVVTQGCLNPLTLTQFLINMNGSSIVGANTNDVTAIHIYYTGAINLFAPINEFSASITPATGTITVNGSQALTAGTNYFWIAYDINSVSATPGNVVDGTCGQITVGGGAKAPVNTTPVVNRAIAACSLAPGGITNESFWVKANQGPSTTTNGTTISQWDDKSGNARNATMSTANNRPTYYDNASKNVNFNPIVDFDDASQSTANGDYMDISSNGILSPGNNPYEVYAVIIPGANNLTTPGKFLFSGQSATNNFNSFDVRSGYSINDSWCLNDLIIGSKWSTDNPSLLTFDYNFTNRTMFSAGTMIGGPSTSAARTSADLNSALGCQRSSMLEFYDGGIAEIITYANATHTTTTREKVESYLAIKYGITLTHNYLASTSAVVWDVTANSLYNNNIIGIAQDDNGGLLQKQSKSTSVSKDILTVYIGSAKQTNQGSNNGTFASGDKSFFMVGSNNASPLSTYPLSTEKPASICCRIMREWLVQQTNFTNTDIKLEFNFNSITTGTLPLNAGDLRLLVDADGNFTDATILNTPAITINAAAGVATITVPASAFTGKPYFTLASVSSNTILPIELTSFTGLCRDNDIQVKWITAQPATTDFTVERSADRVNFTAVGMVKINTSNIYNWIDQSPLPGTMYYRLKTVAANGSVQYSSIIAVNGCNQNHTMLTTDPVTGESTLMLQLLRNETAEINLYDGLGQRLQAPGLTGKRTMSRGLYYIPVKIPGSAAGVYLLSVNINGDKQVYRVMKR